MYELNYSGGAIGKASLAASASPVDRLSRLGGFWSVEKKPATGAGSVSIMVWFGISEISKWRLFSLVPISLIQGVCFRTHSTFLHIMPGRASGSMKA